MLGRVGAVKEVASRYLRPTQNRVGIVVMFVLFLSVTFLVRRM